MSTVELILGKVNILLVGVTTYLLKKQNDTQKFLAKIEKEKFDRLNKEEKQAEEKKIKSKANYKVYLRDQFSNIDIIGIPNFQLSLEKSFIKLCLHSYNYNNKLNHFKEPNLIDDSMLSSSQIEDIEQYNDTTTKFSSCLDSEEQIDTENKTDFFSIFIKEKEISLAKEKSCRILIVGKPGSGKTTLLKWLALQCCNEESIISEYYPVFVSLKHIGKTPSLINKELKEFIVDSTSKTGVDLSFIEYKFKENKLIFLLDGFDEIADEKTRIDTLEWLENQQVFNNPLIVSSRTSGINNTNLFFSRKFKAYEIEDYNIEDIKNFTNYFFKCLNSNPSTCNQVQNKENELIETLNENRYSALLAIATNPLLLVLVIVLKFNKGVLPKNRYKLYEECIRLLIKDWIEFKKILIDSSDDYYSKSLDVLCRIAYKMMKSETRQISKQEVFRITSCLNSENTAQKSFISSLVKKAGILVESEDNYDFLHLTFQEYLAAYYFNLHSKDKFSIVNYASKSFWNESIKLFFDLSEFSQKEEFFSRVIAANDKFYFNNFTLWEQCLLQPCDNDLDNLEFLFVKTGISRILEKKNSGGHEEINLILNSCHAKKHVQRIQEEAWRLYKSKNYFHNLLGVVILANTKYRYEIWESEIEAFNRFSNCPLYDYFVRMDKLVYLALSLRKKNAFIWLLDQLNENHNSYVKFKLIHDILEQLSIHNLGKLKKYSSINHSAFSSFWVNTRTTNSINLTIYKSFEETYYSKMEERIMQNSKDLKKYTNKLKKLITVLDEDQFGQLLIPDINGKSALNTL